jgi:hypothetical protein
MPGATSKPYPPRIPAESQILQALADRHPQNDDDGALAVQISEHARKELEAYLGCGLLCRERQLDVQRDHQGIASLTRRR